MKLSRLAMGLILFWIGAVLATPFIWFALMYDAAMIGMP